MKKILFLLFSFSFVFSAYCEDYTTQLDLIYTEVSYLNVFACVIIGLCIYFCFLSGLKK
jgi:hypothetical protein